MPYKDALQAREASRIRMQKHRQGVTGKDVTPINVTPKPTGDVTPDVTPMPAYMKYLIDKKYRARMEAIVQSLKNHNQLANVRLGVGAQSIPLEVIAELLDDKLIKAY